MSDDIINLEEYLRRRDEGGGGQEPSATFALWGAEGERSRFALPLWRSIYLAGGERGGIVSVTAGGKKLRPLVVLDLARDPARTGFHPWMVDALSGARAPEMVERGVDAHLAIYLGEKDQRRWFMVIDGGDGKGGPLPIGDREDILFLAGECAGLLFLRDFANDMGEDEGSDP